MSINTILATIVATASIWAGPANARVATLHGAGSTLSRPQCTVHQRHIDFVKNANFPHTFNVTNQIDYHGLQFHGFSNLAVPAYRPPGLDIIEPLLPVYTAYNNNQIKVDSGLEGPAVMHVSHKGQSVQETEWLKVNRTWLDNRDKHYLVHAMLRPTNFKLQIGPRFLRVRCTASNLGLGSSNEMCRVRVMVQLPNRSVKQAEWHIPANTSSPVQLDLLSKMGDVFGLRVGFSTTHPAHLVTTVFSDFSYDIRTCNRKQRRMVVEGPVDYWGPTTEDYIEYRRSNTEEPREYRGSTSELPTRYNRYTPVVPTRPSIHKPQDRVPKIDMLKDHMIGKEYLDNPEPSPVAPARPTIRKPKNRGPKINMLRDHMIGTEYLDNPGQPIY